METRRLVLVRHAQAADGPVDADRPLTQRGAGRAAAIGSWLDESSSTPDQVLVSPARRAMQTWEHANGRLPHGRQPTIDPRIYDNTVDALLAAVRDVPEEVRALAVVGHNPSLGELADVLDDGQGDPAARQRLDAGLPTGAVVVFTLGTPFAAIEPGAATLTDVVVPGD